MDPKILISTLLLIFGTISCAPSESSLVVSTTQSSNEGGKEIDGASNIPDFPEIYEMDIATNVSNRFAKTLVTSRVKNRGTTAKETTFTVVLPEKAFISEFVMEVGGKSYKAYVKEKEEAKNIYNAAVASGQTAAHVSVSARDSNKFTVSLNVEPQLKVAFLLTYEELLERRNEQYELILNIHPGQIVKNLHVQVHINESRPLKFVRTPSLRSGNEISKNEDKLDPSAAIDIENSTTATVKFNPDTEQQKKFAHDLGTKESDGLSGQFVVQYDVERDPHGGEVLLQDGYFVHFFAPSELQPLPQHVLFVLDTSSSMYGTKIQQLKDAMKSILKEIKNGDKVSIIEFNSVVKVWDINFENTTDVRDIDYNNPFAELGEQNLPAPVTFNEDLLEKARRVIDVINSVGATNIIGGLETALYLVKVDQERKVSESDKKYQPIILFLTDGDPNVGMSSTEEIVNTVTRLNSKNIPIFSLSFGAGANKAFLRKLSSKNQGFSRHIYEASDASLQLQDFYKQISSPLLSGVNFEYESEVEEVTKKVFPIYFRGSELVVAGRYKNPDFPARVSCIGPVGPIVLRPSIQRPVTGLERLWAYLTVKQLLDERSTADNKTTLTKKALDLALKYSFVTDVTSLVVVKPNDTSAVNAENINEGSSHHNWHRPAAARSGSYPMYASLRGGGRGGGGGAMGLSPRRQYMPVIRTISHGSSSDYSAPQYQHSFALSAPRPDNRLFIRTQHVAYSTTTIPSPTSGTTVAITATPIRDALQKALPWLASVLNPNGTLTVKQNVYELGTHNYNLTVQTDCPKTPTNDSETGNCVLLKDCPEVYSLLADFQTYQTYFCPVDNVYAGICCPKVIF